MSDLVVIALTAFKPIGQNAVELLPAFAPNRTVHNIAYLIVTELVVIFRRDLSARNVPPQCVQRYSDLAGWLLFRGALLPIQS